MTKTFTLITIENYHLAITEYIKENEIIISEYDDMTGCILRMIRDGYCFNMDKNLLRSFLEDLTYMYSPNDEKNKDRIVNMLEESDDDDSDDSDDDEDPDQMAKMMQMLMGGGGMPMPSQSDNSEEKGDIEEIPSEGVN
tara:strand:- start:848 stop:1264 length:417 start_codon:yes stop_codon:yes gene_type:complete